MDPTETGKKKKSNVHCPFERFNFSQVCPSAWTRESLILHFATMVLPLRRTSSPRNTGKGFASQEVYSLHQPVILGKGQYNPWMSSRIDDFVLLRQHEAAKCNPPLNSQVESLPAVKPSPPDDNPVQCHQREQARGCWQTQRRWTSAHGNQPATKTPQLSSSRLVPAK